MMIPPLSTEFDHDDEILLYGNVLSEGIAIGLSYFPEEGEDIELPRFAITADQVDREIERYRKALAMSKEDLEHIQYSLQGEGLQEAVSIISTHLEMLNDPFLTTEMECKIRRKLFNTESVFRSTMQEFASDFSKTANQFFQQRLVDVMGVSKRILDHLHRKPKKGLHEAPLNSVVIANEVDVSEIAAVQALRTAAFVTANGGIGSHAALIARSRGIPYVASIDIDVMKKAKGKWVIVDGTNGRVILNPKSETMARYQQKQIRSNELKEKSDCLIDEVAETIDGHRITLLANVGSQEEIDLLPKVGAEGIGLLRTELLFDDHSQLLSEEIQYAIFRDAIQKIVGRPMVIRLFDFGADKRVPGEHTTPSESNPLLGCRGIRYLFKKRDMLKTHLRAILRAAVEGDVKILVPLVSDVDEMKQIRETIEEVSQELQKEKVDHKKHLPIGCMLEVPSALLMTDALAPFSDFFSLGTNDLTQYVLGIDRINPYTEEVYQPSHPAVLRLMQLSIREAKKRKRAVTVCGETASQPLFVPLLIGLGIHELSIMPRYLPAVKKLIMGISFAQAQQITKKALACPDASAVYQLMMKYFGELL
jgi:phosphotransferase system enzyme I (PtsI)